MTKTALQVRLHDYISTADTKKLQLIYNLVEHEIEVPREWWNDKEFVAELDRRDKALEDGTDKGVTMAQLARSIQKLREKKYGKLK